MQHLRFGEPSTLLRFWPRNGSRNTAIVINIGYDWEGFDKVSKVTDQQGIEFPSPEAGWLFAVLLHPNATRVVNHILWLSRVLLEENPGVRYSIQAPLKHWESKNNDEVNEFAHVKAVGQTTPSPAGYQPSVPVVHCLNEQ